MAAVTMTSSFLAGAAIATSKQGVNSPRRTLIVAKATKGNDQGGNLSVKKEEGSSGRRDLVFAAAAAAAYSVARAAVATEEPKRGTEEAKKKYAPICVTMPTARICRK